MSQLDLFDAPDAEPVTATAQSLTATAESALFLAGLNPQQQDAVMTPIDMPLQVLAGAGTGKTELISRRFVKLVKDLRHKGFARPEESVLVVTFTKDAAQGMRERIHGRLLESGESGLGPQAWISTFHQFCMRLLRLHAWEVGLPPDFVTLNQLEQQVIFNRVMQGVLLGENGDLTALLAQTRLNKVLPDDVLSLPRLEACGIEDVEGTLSPQRVYGLINRIKTAGLSPLEFYQTACAQSAALTEALKQLPTPHYKDSDKLDNMLAKLEAWVSALQPWAHADWNPIADVERKAEKKGKKLTPSDYKAPVEGLAKFYLVPKTFEPAFPETGGMDILLSVELQLIGMISAIYALYQDRLLKEGACDFDDLINHTIRLLEVRPDLRQRYQNQFEAVIVDEFQDSNGSQLRLLSLVVREGSRNLTVVGDEKQSIYAFRFAQPENLRLIFGNHPHKTVNLQTNYRSYPPVLGVANHLTDQITRYPNQRLNPSEKNAPHQAPLVTWLSFDEPVEKDDGSLAKKPIALQKEREAQFIAIEIARLAQTGDYHFSDMAILVKSHAKAEQIQGALADLGIPSIKSKTLGFFQESVIKDALALLRLMCDLSDELSLTRILQVKLNHRQLLALMALKKRLPHSPGHARPSLFDACLSLKSNPAHCPELSAGVAEAVGDLAFQLLAIRKRKARLSPVQLFLALAGVVGLIAPETPEWLKKQQRIRLKTFEKLLYLFGQNKPIQPTLDEVLDILNQYEANPNQELPVSEELSGEDAVRIMTVFAAKGLEFPVVFVAYADKSGTRGGDDTLLLFDPQYAGKAGFGLVLGKLNGLDNLKKEVYQKSWMGPRSATEAQRVFYVALTRAMRKLYVLRSDQSADWTAAAEYPSEWVEALSEVQHEHHLSITYWLADKAPIRQAMAALQAKEPAASSV
ncbi:ATP-dependent helicase [Vampirovibrio sp.]|uniref:ATP-dependent helicase n=1 Tax=Vampirovibrio sp. TaxID=2717857 RepID=UPI003592F155